MQRSAAGLGAARARHMRTRNAQDCKPRADVKVSRSGDDFAVLARRANHMPKNIQKKSLAVDLARFSSL
jgi:hypothetical protein